MTSQWVQMPDGTWAGLRIRMPDGSWADLGEVERPAGELFVRGSAGWVPLAAGGYGGPPLSIRASQPAAWFKVMHEPGLTSNLLGTFDLLRQSGPAAVVRAYTRVTNNPDGTGSTSTTQDPSSMLLGFSNNQYWLEGQAVTAHLPWNPDPYHQYIRQVEVSHDSVSIDPATWFRADPHIKGARCRMILGAGFEGYYPGWDQGQAAHDTFADTISFTATFSLAGGTFTFNPAAFTTTALVNSIIQITTPIFPWSPVPFTAAVSSGLMPDPVVEPWQFAEGLTSSMIRSRVQIRHIWLDYYDDYGLPSPDTYVAQGSPEYGWGPP